MEANVFEKMSTKELETFKLTYKDNPSVVAIVDVALIQRKAEEVAAAVKAKFADGIAKLVGKLPHPEDVYNIYMAWREVEEQDTTKPASEVTITDSSPILDKDGKITTPAVSHVEKRHPSIRVSKWVVELNKGFSVQKSSGTTTTPGTSKRAILVSKRNVANPNNLEIVGNYRTGAEACQHLHIEPGQGSANLALTKAGYFLEPMHEGASFTIAKQ